MAHHYGYAGMILRVDLSAGTFATVPTSDYSDRFIGGRGIAARIHWDEVGPEVIPTDPRNCLVFMTGPFCGLPGLAGSRWQISGKSPATNSFSYANVGGVWGAYLKFSGYDGIIIQGKAASPAYLLIGNGKLELRDASLLRGKGAIDTRDLLQRDLGKSFRVVAIGPAGENIVSFATLLADSDSSGSSGFGAVMGAKNLKAIAVQGQQNIEVADRQNLDILRKTIKELKVSPNIITHSLPPDRFSKDVCYGCIDGCVRATYSATDGTAGKFFCQSAIFYDIRSRRHYGQATEVPFRANKICDNFGVDTRTIETMLMWLSRCYKAGALTEDETGLAFSKIGSFEFLNQLITKIVSRDGFGAVLAEGTYKAAETIGRGTEQFITDFMISTGENSVYGPRLYLTTALFYAMEPRMPIQHLHEISFPAMAWVMNQMKIPRSLVTSEVIRAVARRFWGGEVAADFSTIEGKPMAAVQIQNREYAKECLILCDLCWPIMLSRATPDYVGDPTLENRLFTAVTGKDVDENGLYRIGERVFNLQRAILVREGRGGRMRDTPEKFEFSVPLKGDFGNPECIVPGPGGYPFSRKGMVLDRVDFEQMKDEYYQIRGWDISTGLQRASHLQHLGLADIALDLSERGLLVC